MRPEFYNYGSEQAIIGAILLKPENLTKVRAELTVEDFGSDKHQALFSALGVIAENRDPVEPSVIVTELERTGNLERAGGKEYLFEIAESIHTSAGLDYHIDSLKEARARRILSQLSEKILNDLRAGIAVHDILSDLRNSVIQMNTRRKEKVISHKEALARTIDRIETLSKAGGRLTGIPSGFINIDHFTGGWQGGELIIIAGRPGMGKSIFAKDFAEASGVPVVYFSLEMSVEELTKRQLSSKAKVNFEHLRTGRINANDWTTIIKAADTLAGIPIHYIDTANIAVDELIATSEKLKMTRQVGLVVIDYLQLIRTKERLEIREREVSEISRKLKGMARSLEIPVICLAQLNRQCEARTNKRPMLSDLRESGSLEQDADIVGFIYREHVYDERAMKHRAEFIIAKGRNIRTGTVNLYFDGEHQTFRDATRD